MPSATPVTPPNSRPSITRSPDTSKASSSFPFWISCHPASKISCGAGNTSPGMSPVALSSCQSTSSAIGDDHRRMLRRWVSQTLVTAGATVLVTVIAPTLADGAGGLKGLAPCEGNRLPRAKNENAVSAFAECCCTVLVSAVFRRRLTEDLLMQKAIDPSISTWPDDDPQLIGSQCGDCSATTFPAQDLCPRCSGSKMSEIQASAQWNADRVDHPGLPSGSSLRRPDRRRLRAVRGGSGAAR